MDNNSVYGQMPGSFWDNSPGQMSAPAKQNYADTGAGQTNGMGAAGTGAAIGAGIGLLQTLAQQNAYQAKMRTLAATTRFSPWTHMSMAQPETPNALAPIGAMAASGAALGQGLGGGSMVPMAQMNSRNPFQTNIYGMGGQ